MPMKPPTSSSAIHSDSLDNGSGDGLERATKQNARSGGGRNWARWFAAGAALLLLALVAWRLWPTPLQHGIVVQAPERAFDFTLTDEMGQPVQLSDFRGQYVLLSFGYTACPDVCPLTLAELARAVDALGARADRVQVLFVSVDPARDNPALLDGYMHHFHPSFHGATGTADALLDVATQYGVYFERRADSAFIDHTATVTVVDPKGYIRAVFPYGVAGADMAADLTRLMR